MEAPVNVSLTMQLITPMVNNNTYRWEQFLFYNYKDEEK
jgi:hypothetical protein